MTLYGCHSDKIGEQPRGRTTTALMQSGWRYMRRGEDLIREPVMVAVTTNWLPMKCGHIQQAGKGKDQLCKGCANEKERANV